MPIADIPHAPSSHFWLDLTLQHSLGRGGPWEILRKVSRRVGFGTGIPWVGFLHTVPEPADTVPVQPRVRCEVYPHKISGGNPERGGKLSDNAEAEVCTCKESTLRQC